MGGVDVVVVIAGVLQMFVRRCVCVCLLYILGQAEKHNNLGGPVRDIYTAL